MAASRLVVAAALSVILAACSVLPKERVEEPPQLLPPPRPQREVFTVRRGSVQEKVVLRAGIASAREQGIYFKTAGRMKGLHVAAGDAVQEGQLIAELETGDQELKLQQAEIALQRAQVRLEQLRHKAQFQGGPDAWDVKLADLDVKHAEITLQREREALAGMRIVAPFAGRVLNTAGKVGDLVQAFAPVVTLADPRDLLVVADVDDATLLKIAPGMKAVLSFADLGGERTGELVQLPLAAEGRKQARIRFAAPEPRAQMGMAGRATIILQEKRNVLLLPNAAVRAFAGRTYVVVQGEGGVRREVDIATGIVGETETEILRGLNEGDQVVGP